MCLRALPAGACVAVRGAARRETRTRRCIARAGTSVRIKLAGEAVWTQARITAVRLGEEGEENPYTLQPLGPGGSDEGAPIDCERDQFQLREHQKHSMGQSARISDIGAVLGLFFADEKRKALATHTDGFIHLVVFYDGADPYLSASRVRLHISVMALGFLHAMAKTGSSHVEIVDLMISSSKDDRAFFHVHGVPAMDELLAFLDNGGKDTYKLACVALDKKAQTATMGTQSSREQRDIPTNNCPKWLAKTTDSKGRLIYWAPANKTAAHHKAVLESKNKDAMKYYNAQAPYPFGDLPMTHVQHAIMHVLGRGGERIMTHIIMPILYAMDKEHKGFVAHFQKHVAHGVAVGLRDAMQVVGPSTFGLSQRVGRTNDMLAWEHLFPPADQPCSLCNFGAGPRVAPSGGGEEKGGDTTADPKWVACMKILRLVMFFWRTSGHVMQTYDQDDFEVLANHHVGFTMAMLDTVMMLGGSDALTPTLRDFACQKPHLFDLCRELKTTPSATLEKNIERNHLTVEWLIAASGGFLGGFKADLEENARDRLAQVLQQVLSDKKEQEKTLGSRSAATERRHCKMSAERACVRDRDEASYVTVVQEAYDSVDSTATYCAPAPLPSQARTATEAPPPVQLGGAAEGQQLAGEDVGEDAEEQEAAREAELQVRIQQEVDARKAELLVQIQQDASVLSSEAKQQQQQSGEVQQRIDEQGELHVSLDSFQLWNGAGELLRWPPKPLQTALAQAGVEHFQVAFLNFSARVEAGKNSDALRMQLDMDDQSERLAGAKDWRMGFAFVPTNIKHVFLTDPVDGKATLAFGLFQEVR